MAASESRGARFLRGLENQLFGFGILDGIYIVGLFVIGSYFLFDVPVHFALFGLYFHLVTSGSRKKQRFALFVMVVATTVLISTGFAILALPRVTPESTHLRLFHQTGSRYFILLVMPYLLSHVRSSLEGRPLPYRVTTKLGWMFLKAAFWVGAIPAMMTIRGNILWLHNRLLLVAAPLVILHVAWSWQRQRAGKGGDLEPPQPFSVRERGDARLYGGALLVAAALVTLAATYENPEKWPRYFERGIVFRAAQASFAPSPAATQSGGTYQPEFLGASNSCGRTFCHLEIFGKWRDSVHRHATNAFYRSEVQAVMRDKGAPAARLCAGCHDPISLFSGSVDFGEELMAPEALRDGISCLVCHSLSPAPGPLGNGSVRFRFPEHYYEGPVTLPVLVGSWYEHSLDMNGPGIRDDRLCVSCHRFLPVAPSAAHDLPEDWLDRVYHRQWRMTPACRGEQHCIECHMPRDGPEEKPGNPVPRHSFLSPEAETELEWGQEGS